MNDVLFISVDDIKDNTSIKQSVDPKFLEPYILVSQQLFVQPIIGDALYYDLQNAATADTLSTDYSVLLLAYIKPLLCFASWLQASPFLFARTTPAGIVRDSNSIDKDEFGAYKQGILDNVTYYSERLRKYLIKNENSFPLFRDDTNYKGYNNLGPIYFGPSNIC